MTEFLIMLKDFLADNATAGNLSAIVGAIGMLISSRINAKLKAKSVETQAHILKKDTEIKELNDKVCTALEAMTNMYVIAFGNSKLAPEVKVALEAKKDEVFKVLNGTKTEVEPETIKIETEIETKDLSKEKSVIEQLQEEL